MIHPEKPPRLVYANSQGEIVDLPDLLMAGKSGRHFFLPKVEELIPLPEGSELFVLPGRLPVGIDPQDNTPTSLSNAPWDANEPVNAVAAFMAPAHTALYTAAYETLANAPTLPLFAYTAVGWREGKFWVTALRSDIDCRQDSNKFRQSRIDRKTLQRLNDFPDNRLIQHLGKCCLTYGCPAARNYFLGRWEAPLPSSPVCNARCVGCISLQKSGCCPATQDRITFVPTVEELGEIAIPHLESAPLPVVSFGQGCEGEPLMQADTLEKSITHIRHHTNRGTINLNSNSGLPDSVARLADAGLDSIRVSMNSAQKEKHGLYYRPKGFSFDDVRRSIRIMKERGRWVSLNYFILPGFTDDPTETEAFYELIEAERPDYIQLRNLNMDPEWYFQVIEHTENSPPLGMKNWLQTIMKTFPWLRYGYFNPPLPFNEEVSGMAIEGHKGEE